MRRTSANRSDVHAAGANALLGKAAVRLMALLLWAGIVLVGGWGGEARGDEASDAAAQRLLTAAQARAKAAERQARGARERLDAFLAEHFAAIEAIDPPPAVTLAPAASAPAGIEGTRLRTELGDLRAKREGLLRTLTESHPEVIDVEGQIAAVEAQLAALGTDSAAATELLAKASGQELSRYVERLRRDSQASAAEGAQLLAEWRSAESALAEAHQRVAELERELAARPPAGPAIAEAHAPPQPPVQTAPQAAEAPLHAAPTLHVAPAGPSAGMQMLVLSALAVALALSALAAVRLARASADPVFASADEAAAALAIPVVGILPRGASRLKQTAARAGRWSTLAWQLALAAGLFLVIVYAIEHAERIAAFVQDPVPALRTLIGV